MGKIIKGRVWKLGDKIDTDRIYPGRYLPILDSKEMAQHALEGVDPELARQMQPGDILVAGIHFGCGSSREQAVHCLKALGIACIVAKSFARIFFRNAIHLGLPVVECKEAVDQIQQGEIIIIDVEKGILETSQKNFQFHPFHPMIQEILDAGGLIPYIQQKTKGG